MNVATQILCNGFPRTVAASSGGMLHQNFIHSESEFDLFFDHNRDNKNVYMNISRFREDMRPVTGDFPFDFDSPMKDSAFQDNVSDRIKIRRMRNDEELAEDVLGGVWRDVQKLVEYCWKENIPVVSVFSGLGVHCHLLFQERVNPTKQKTTTSQYLINELDLYTYDTQIITDTKRILRVPNSKRIDDGRDCEVYCIPMTEPEVLNNSLHDMLERCREPKNIEYHSRYKPENRPEMQIYENVEKIDDNAVGTVELEDRDVSEEVEGNAEYIIRSCIPLPCVSERFLRRNPEHKIRFSGAAFLYQVGFRPDEVREIIRNIGWIDYDPDITRKMTDSIWKKRYTEMSCSSLRTHGLCVYGPEFEDYSNKPKDCETFDYTPTQSFYPYDQE